MSIMARFSLYAMSVTDGAEKFYAINTKSIKISKIFIYLNLGGFIIAIFASYFLKYDLDKFTKELTSNIFKPSDFALKVNNIP
jgi:hypothetical protein